MIAEISEALSSSRLAFLAVVACWYARFNSFFPMSLSFLVEYELMDDAEREWPMILAGFELGVHL